MSERPTVVVTGLGAITPLGGDVASTWEGMLAGRSGITLGTLRPLRTRILPSRSTTNRRESPRGEVM